MKNEPHPNAASGKSKSGTLTSGLYLVATPIGNLEDITLRALRILKDASIIACEDTRTSATLLRHYGITTPTLSYHEHNGEQMRPKLLARLAEGQSIALISDAGTPLISDPGYKLVGEVATAGYAVFPIPGPCALIAGLTASGLPTDRFLFLGFAPPKQGARRELALAHKTTDATLIFYESPGRLTDTLADFITVFGPTRQATVSRELTKLHEEHNRNTLADLLAHYTATPPRGEIVLLIAPGAAEKATPESIDTMLRDALTSHSVKDAAALVADATGEPKRTIYQRALELAKE